jgi:nucleotide-binding universal stress UspA family protein
MRSIFVPIGGGESDTAVMETALAIATPLSAHLEFMHVRIEAGEAARHTPHVDFARGVALHNALAELEQDAATRAAGADRHVREFCSRRGIAMRDRPGWSHHVTAHWREERGPAMEQLLFHARHHDLTVMARHSKADGVAANRLETVLLQSGRPLVIAPAKVSASALHRVLVCWKESADAARALTAAMPILMKADKVDVVALPEKGQIVEGGLAEVVRQLQWSGISADYAVLGDKGLPVSATLLAAARERNAGLMVMGGYGHSHTRQFVFGGCTRDMLEGADIAVLLAH